MTNEEKISGLGYDPEQMQELRECAGADDWEVVARTLLRATCAVVDDWVPGDTNWPDWLKAELNAICAEQTFSAPEVAAHFDTKVVELKE